MPCDVVIAGAGPAGVSCAVTLSRSGLTPLLVNEGEIGGTVNNAFSIENFPGSGPLSGAELARKLERDLSRLSIEVIAGTVSDVAVNPEGGVFNMTVHGQEVTARRVVAATGTRPRRIPRFEVPGRTFYEVRQMRGTEGAVVAVAGSGEAAYDSALTLKAWGNRVLLLTKKGPEGLSPRLVARVLSTQEIDVRMENPALAVSLEGDALSVRTSDGMVRVDYLLVSIGREPDLMLLKTEETRHHRDFHVCGDARFGRLGHCDKAFQDGEAVAGGILAGRAIDGTH